MLSLIPKDEKFYDQLELMARHVVDASQEFGAIIQAFPHSTNAVEAIELKRQAARKLAQESLSRLDRAFITPLDREDILALIGEMYQVVNLVAQLSQRFKLYPMTSLHASFSGQTHNLQELALQVERIIGSLRKDTKLSALADGAMARVQEIEEAVKRCREEFLSELFKGEPDPIELIKKKELNDLIEDGIERLDDVTQTLARVMLKNA
jgi:uncharacterized protein Yka (UPF0111/DUF47 family)